MAISNAPPNQQDTTRTLPPIRDSGERPASINDSLPTSNPSGRTVLFVLGGLGLVVLVLVFHSTFGF
jgi:hypothetical protein